ncbi:phosphatase PAP2 family protein [Mucilaginibacter conchicola]|uniref:Phosphatase PAP2 family protein n=1 Tax=Mucilaginibacter conchicola TaxID=2303333 RepID=A0A372NUN3_9SPHI|nr:vanadium-dependent haloperoxidase [Mucilaginibacter conchicola]RFZ92734.1 phosphatase PAP2 family protein [Mucilaginibacter conchicola]
MRIFYAVLTFALCLCACKNTNNNWQQKAEDPAFIHRSIRQVTDVMVRDIYSPPVASRIYAYISVAGYEAAVHGDKKYISLAKQLKGLDSIPQPVTGKPYCYSLAASHAILIVGKILVMSEGRIEKFHDELLQQFRDTGIPDDVYQNSLDYGKLVANHILKWAGRDNYKHTRTLARYDVQTDAATWKPTPPAYMKGVEPHWNEIRPFILDSAQQFKPAHAMDFSTAPTSYFYTLAKDVQNAGNKLTDEQRDIANFWDDNPFKVNTNGHTMFAIKKISPGGHWINIAAQVCRKAKADYVQTAETYACLSVVIADAFINCWDEKYKSKVIRPETYINEYIDERWQPLLQTPPFPEYTSGHSVVSNASAVVMSKLFGDKFAFADSTETLFDLPVRKFTSFKAAADEASISRFYGGIHYMPSIRNGVDEGVRIGEFALNKLHTRKAD